MGMHTQQQHQHQQQANQAHQRPEGLLIDLDGTLYHGGQAIAGAASLISALRGFKIPFLFVTNNSSASPELVAERLRAMGITAHASDVCTSAQAAAAHLAQLQPGARVHIVGEEGLRLAVQESGLRLVEEQADFVLQGIDRGLGYERLAHAVRLLLEGATYVLTNPDKLLPTEDGLKPGAGAIGAMLEAASGKKPLVIGKPSSILVNYALQRLGSPAEGAWMVGDNPATDIAAANAAGCTAVLVLTGLASRANMNALLAASGVTPHLVCDTLAELEQQIRTLAEQ